MTDTKEEIKVWDKGVARWVITTPEGDVVHVSSLSKYCKEFGINYQMLLRKHRTQTYLYKGYIIRRKPIVLTDPIKEES